MNPVIKTREFLQLLHRLLDEPNAVALIQHLDAKVLGTLINHLGLEESGELIAMATAGQLARIFDEDLWRSQAPGKEEEFDAERFALWLGVMLETDPKEAASKLAKLDRDFVVMALSRYVLVLNSEEFKRQMMASEEDEERMIDKALENSLNFEFSRHMIISRLDRYWDAVLTLLVELDQQYPENLENILDRLSRFSAVMIEDEGGLYSILSASQQLDNDVADEREQRRATEGFVAPVEAAQFLTLARRPDQEESFRLFSRATRQDLEKQSKVITPSTEHPESLSEWLAGQELLEGRPPLLPGDTAPWLIHVAMARLAQSDTRRHSQRLLEVSYLANVLIAGCPFQDRRFRPFEAGQAAVAVCNVGLEQLAGEKTEPNELMAMLEKKDNLELFRAGWSLLHEHVAMATAKALLAMLKAWQLKTQAEKDAKQEQLKIIGALEKSMAAGKPWEASDQLHLLEPTLDAAHVIALRALLAELPLFPGFLQAGVQEKYQFIYSKAQVEQIREFLKAINRL